MKSFTLPPRESVATPEILVTSHVSEKSQASGEVVEEQVEGKVEEAEEGGKGGGSSVGGKKDGATNEKTEDFEDGGVPLIYLCATCWHETESEMLSLVKSLFRSVGGESVFAVVLGLLRSLTPVYHGIDAARLRHFILSILLRLPAWTRIRRPVV